MKTKLLYTIGMVCIHLFLNAQSTGKDILYQSDKLYQQGKIEEVIKLLEPSVDKGLNNEECFDAYRLLALSYLYLQNTNKTDFYMKKMLKSRVDYQKYPNIDPLEFSKLINRYEVRPLWQVGIKAGANLANPVLQNSYSAFVSNQSYLSTTGYQFGAFCEYMIKSNISISADVMMNGFSINQKIDNAGGWSQNYIEDQQATLMNLSCNYYKKISEKMQVYGGIGIGVNYITSALVNLESVNLQTGETFQSTKDALNERNTLPIYASFKLGVAYQSRVGKLGIDCSYLNFFTNTVNKDTRYNDQNFIFNNQYVNDDISMRMMLINISYKTPLKWLIKL